MENEKVKIINEFLPQLKSLLNSETVFGDPYEVGNVTLIPVNTVKVGFAFGDSESKAKKRDSNAGGGGILYTPVAFIVVKGEDVSIHNLNAGTIENVMDKIPDVVDKFGTILQKFQRNNESSEE